MAASVTHKLLVKQLVSEDRMFKLCSDWWIFSWLYDPKVIKRAKNKNFIINFWKKEVKYHYHYHYHYHIYGRVEPAMHIVLQEYNALSTRGPWKPITMSLHFYEEKWRKTNVTILWIMVQNKPSNSYGTAVYTACPPCRVSLPFYQFRFCRSEPWS